MKIILIVSISLFSFLISCQKEVESVRTDLISNETSNAKIEISSTPTPRSNSKDINLKIGIVDGSKENICFRTKNRSLPVNTPVSIVTSLHESPQKVLNASVDKKFEKACSRYASESTDKNPGENYYYALTLTENGIDEYQEIFGIGVIEPETLFQFKNNFASIDLDNDGNAEFFRRCAGFEGVLFAIWTGEPLTGKQIWHSFYYLDYDTEPSCKELDLEK